ncbi:protein COFACTOR ASSEMBLY OF COMPLEX C SUBUNIT B CCB2 [Cucumis melo var. makuwa]|uniref:Protein COFACTOR ASSEMBLY OF COMPLEX C SUBUNIT B CCB2 n=1 Tax=Cucumis melo var. makuwa TaxID=1194695 RepID=A0A5D3CVL5_CUCMM|nr:protein COFACTOR ASSEMBLY OF COMPLEX C SUBUNIT B CCB2 [Cucumis melo var. makuwa]
MKRPSISARLDDSKNSTNQQLHLSILQFALDISLFLSNGLQGFLGYWWLQVPCYLDDASGWGFEISELKKQLESA